MPSNITAELDIALAVLKVTSQVNGNTRNPKIIRALKMKFGIIDYDVEGNPQPTFRNSDYWGLIPMLVK